MKKTIELISMAQKIECKYYIEKNAMEPVLPHLLKTLEILKTWEFTGAPPELEHKVQSVIKSIDDFITTLWTHQKDQFSGKPEYFEEK